MPLHVRDAKERGDYHEAKGNGRKSCFKIDFGIDFPYYPAQDLWQEMYDAISSGLSAKL